ncbi:MAG: hypothetical protein WC438_04700 [Candidatus Pacearchaeota archaeon]
MNKKGQAAMEFLMTYGWAILAAVIAIGVLAYFGVFSPGKYVTGNAVVNPPFYINAYNIKASDGVTLEIKDNGGEDYTLTSVVVSGCGTYSTSTPITTDAPAVITVTCAPALTEGDTLSEDITITYTKEGSTVELTSTGTVAGKVVA